MPSITIKIKGSKMSIKDKMMSRVEIESEISELEYRIGQAWKGWAEDGPGDPEVEAEMTRADVKDGHWLALLKRMLERAA